MAPTAEDEKIAGELTRRLVAEFQPDRIVWFGSRSRGEGNHDSDWDLLVVVNSPAPLSDRLFRAQRATADVHVAKDVVVCTPVEYAKLRDWRSSVVAEADLTGRVVYEAA